MHSEGEGQTGVESLIFIRKQNPILDSRSESTDDMKTLNALRRRSSTYGAVSNMLCTIHCPRFLVSVKYLLLNPIQTPHCLSWLLLSSASHPWWRRNHCCHHPQSQGGKTQLCEKSPIQCNPAKLHIRYLITP